MACVWSNPQKSPYWNAQFTAPDGRRVNKSTKQTDKRKAQRIADEWEKASASARAHELTQAQGIKVLGELMEIAGLAKLKVSTIKQSLDGYLTTRKSLGKNDSTISRYEPIVESFLKHIGEARASASIGSVSTSEIEEWRDSELKKGKSGTTVDFGISVLRAVLNAEQRKGLISHNPAAAVEKVGEGAETRECFTEEQLKSLWDAASDEWKVMILLGGDYGMRLSDASNLTWGQVDLLQKTFTYLPAKTANKQKDPLKREISSELDAALTSLPEGVGKDPLLPSLYGKKPGSHGGLSNQFSSLMETAGIKPPLGREKKGDGRQFRRLGYHSLKHSAISRMAEAGISSEQRRALVGGHSEAVHQKYTHTSEKAQKAARSKMSPLIRNEIN